MNLEAIVLPMVLDSGKHLSMLGKVVGDGDEGQVLHNEEGTL